MQLFQKEKNNLVQDLKMKHGSYYENITMEEGQYRKVFSCVNASRNVSSERTRENS